LSSHPENVKPRLPRIKADGTGDFKNKLGWGRGRRKCKNSTPTHSGSVQ